MKRILFILFAFGLMLPNMAQTFELDQPDTKLFYFWAGTDTITETVDTVSREYPYILEGANWKYQYSLKADSLDGTPAGAAYLQYSLKYDPETWINLDTLNFNGSGTYTATGDNLSSSAALMALKLRLYALTTDTLSTIRLTEAWILLKR